MATCVGVILRTWSISIKWNRVCSPNISKDDQAKKLLANAKQRRATMVGNSNRACAIDQLRSSFCFICTMRKCFIWRLILDNVFFFQTQYFAGNRDRNTAVMYPFNPPIRCQYLRVVPWSWRTRISMRVEAYGCYTGKKRSQWLVVSFVQKCGICFYFSLAHIRWTLHWWVFGKLGNDKVFALESKQVGIIATWALVRKCLFSSDVILRFSAVVVKTSY